jgi:hypothetical protein
VHCVGSQDEDHKSALAVHYRAFAAPQGGLSTAAGHN